MTAISRRSVLIAMGTAAGAALGTSLLGCSTGATASALRLAAGEAGGPYFQFAELVSEALRNRRTAELEVIATGGSIENLDLLASRSVDLAIALADTATGSGHDYSAGGSPPEFVALGRVYQNYLQCIVRDDGAVRSLEDLAGRRVSIGAPGSGSAFMTRRILAVVGLDSGHDTPVVTEHLLEDATGALADGEIDAFFWSGGIPTASIESLRATTPIALLDLSSAFAALNEAYPNLYRLTEIPTGVYGTSSPTKTIGVANFLLALPDLADSIVRGIVDVLVQDSEDLVPEGSVGVQYLTLAGLIDTGPIGLHPAALRRYRELYG